MLEPELFLQFIRPLNRSGIRHVIGGSVAAIFYGEPRLTIDVDVMMFLRDSDVEKLRAVFPSPEFYVPPDEVIRREIQRPAKGQFNLIHIPTSFKADIFTTGRDDLNAWAFRNKRVVDYKGTSLVLVPPEFIIVRKLEYLREGESYKHIRDIRSILKVTGEQLDHQTLTEWVSTRGVQEEWRKVTG